MSDITTTATALDLSTVAVQLPPVTDRRAGMFDYELMQREVTGLRAEIARLRDTQITDGSDPRLVTFWERVGRIADNADFCEEYDRIAEAMNGPRRERDYYVTLEVTIHVTMRESATSDDEAGDKAGDSLTLETLRDAIANGDVEIQGSDVYATELN